MTKPMNNLLKVLEIESEEQQIKALYELGYTEYFAKRKCGDGFKYECRTGSLADLMFRLRGECDDVKFMEGQKAVYLAYHYEEKHWEKNCLKMLARLHWLSLFAYGIFSPWGSNFHRGLFDGVNTISQ